MSAALPAGNAPAEPFEHLQRSPEIDPSAFIAATAMVLGDVQVGAGASLWFGVVARGDVQAIRIGARSNIQDGTVIHASTGGAATQVGNDCTVGHAAVLHACVLEDWAFVGFGALVLDRCRIESDGMLAAGGVLTPGKTIRAGELWAGNPARFLRLLTPQEIAANRLIAPRYQALAQAHGRLRAAQAQR